MAQALELDVEEHNALAERTQVTGCLPPRFYRSWLFSGSGVLGDRGEAGGSEGALME